MFYNNNCVRYGHYLKELRKKLKLSQSAVRAKTGINQDTIRKIELGAVIPKYDTLAALSSVYKVDLIEKFSEFSVSNNLLRIYKDIDICLLDNNVTHLNALLVECKTQHHRKMIKDELMTQGEYDQLVLYIEALLIFMRYDHSQFEEGIYKLHQAMILTNPTFRLKNFDTLAYNGFELRLLLLYALLSAKTIGVHVSNRMLEFMLDWIHFIYSNQMTVLSYLIKVHFNLSYNYHNLDDDIMALKHANLGIQYATEQGYFKEVYGLYYRKFVAEYHLGNAEYLQSLRKSLMIMDILGNKRLLDEYIRITHSKYGIDARTLFFT